MYIWVILQHTTRGKENRALSHWWQGQRAVSRGWQLAPNPPPPGALLPSWRAPTDSFEAHFLQQSASNCFSRRAAVLGPSPLLQMLQKPFKGILFEKLCKARWELRDRGGHLFCPHRGAHLRWEAKQPTHRRKKNGEIQGWEGAAGTKAWGWGALAAGKPWPSRWRKPKETLGLLRVVWTELSL